MTVSETLARVLGVYTGSNGNATVALYDELRRLGAAGDVAAELMRAQKASERAKAYRGGHGGRSYRSMAYGKKEWSLGRLCTKLVDVAGDVGIAWGWGVDPAQPMHRHVLYVELPTGQVSFHAGDRGIGPDYPGTWDGVRNVSAQRIVLHAARLIDGAAG